MSIEQMSGASIPGRKEALLPTPPSHHIVKLDTNLTCKNPFKMTLCYILCTELLFLSPIGGVPLNVMELLSFPPDGSSEMVQVIQVSELCTLSLLDSTCMYCP